MASVITEKTKIKTRVPEAVSSFIKKTFELLEDQKYPEVIDWSPDGAAIIIKNPTEFSKKVLPTYFKHNNLTSFVRQLNMYDFHKRRTQQYDHVYYHDLFQRKKRNLLQDIKRKNQDTAFANIQKALDSLETNQAGQSQEPNSNSYENHLLKKLNKDALGRISSLEGKVKDLTIQNQALWNQITHQNQKEDLLVSLLANFMKKKGIALDQLPEVLTEQFNLPPLDIHVQSKPPKKDSANTFSENLLDIKMSADSKVNMSKFLSFNDNSSSSTDITVGDYEKYFSPVDKASVSSGVLENMRTMPSNRESNLISGGHEWNVPQSNHPRDVIPETQFYPKSVMNRVERANKIDFEPEQVLGKRDFVRENEDFWGTHKFVKQNPFQRGMETKAFFANTINSSYDFSEIKVNKNDSFTELCLSGGNQNNMNFDLLHFN